MVSRSPILGLPAGPLTLLLLVAVCSVVASGGGVQAAAEPQAEKGRSLWHRVGTDNKKQVILYFFWSASCPHCLEAKPRIEAMAAARPWLALASRPVDRSLANQAMFAELAQITGNRIQGVPTFFVCGRMVVGYSEAGGTGAALMRLAEACRKPASQQSGSKAAAAPPATSRIRIPVFGTFALDQLSMPVLTLVLGSLDAFNPCAFFVLLTLLGLMVHGRSRWRMLLIGGVFVLFSGGIYFLFMTAWLNLFVLLEGFRTVTVAAALVALAVGALNIKDYFALGRGPSLSIPQAGKSGLFARMRGLLSAESLPAMVMGTAVLAIAANAFELLCTSGFPMVFTRILTLSVESSSGRYFYLALYNVAYVLPLLVIVVAFAATLGARKLSEAQGRRLKLMSGMMMAGLGLVLLLVPAALTNIVLAVGLLAAALLVAFLTDRATGYFRRRRA